MTKLNRRTFLAGIAAASSVRVVPVVIKSAPAKRVLTLVYDKSLGMMRAVDRVVR